MFSYFPYLFSSILRWILFSSIWYIILSPDSIILSIRNFTELNSSFCFLWSTNATGKSIIGVLQFTFSTQSNLQFIFLLYFPHYIPYLYSLLENKIRCLVILRKLVQWLVPDTLVLLNEPGYEAFLASKKMYMGQLELDKSFLVYTNIGPPRKEKKDCVHASRIHVLFNVS